MKTKLTLVLAAFVLLFAGACKKSVEGETKSWDSNVQTVKTLMSKYPGFKTPLESALTSATKVMDDAKALTDEEAKIQKMSEANGILNSGWVSDLNKVDDWKKSLRDQVSKVNTGTLDEGDRIAADFAVKNADRALNSVDRTLQSGAQDEATAASVLKSLKSEIDAATKDLAKILGNVKNKQNEAEKEKKDAEDKAKAEEEKVADWKCGYCEKSNKHDAKECGGCGAPRE